jgi:DNA-binding HxlR family transcriptional regulator
MAKSYQIEDCPVARTLDVVGERWTLLLLRDLLLHGPRRFQDFQTSLPGVAPNTLSVRLKSMEDNGLVRRELYSERPPRLEYVLTDKGRSLGPVVKAMRDWGSKRL